MKVYNDLEVHARLWAFWKAAEMLPSEYVRIVIGPQTVRPVKIVLTEEILSKTEKIIRQILRGIRDDVFYPAFSEQCNICPFKQKCRI